MKYALIVTASLLAFTLNEAQAVTVGVGATGNAGIGTTGVAGGIGTTTTTGTIGTTSSTGSIGTTTTTGTIGSTAPNAAVSTGIATGTMNGTGASATGNTGAATTDWNTQSTYWRNQYRSRPYYSATRDYSAYEPAYHFGADLSASHPGTRFEDLDQTQLQNDWLRTRGTSTLTWQEAQAAARDAYLHGSASGTAGGGVMR